MGLRRGNRALRIQWIEMYIPLFQINLWSEEIVWWIYSTSFHNPATCLQKKKSDNNWMIVNCSRIFHVFYSLMMGEILPKRKCNLFSFSIRSWHEPHLQSSYQRFLKIDVIFKVKNKKVLSFKGMSSLFIYFFGTGIFDWQSIDADPKSGKN